MRTSRIISATLFYIMAITTHHVSAQTAPPPTLGEETKGQPAQLEVNDTTQSSAVSNTTNQPLSESATNTSSSLTNTLLGHTTIKESRRESGQVYRIELQHSSGSTQVLEEHDSDGQLGADDNGLDDTPNLTKWKLGSW